MVELRLDEIAQKMKGMILQGEPSISFDRFNIDSRQTVPGELFFAIIGRRDGHDFIPSAAKKGAGGAVVSRSVSIADKSFALVRVEDTLTALQILAQSVLSGSKVKVVGITGSIGKTTTKEFTSRLLSGKFRVLKSEGNFNNHLGLALSVLRMNERHEIVVLEMAMSATGEIRNLTRIAPPDISVITNIHPVHLQFFSGLEEIALAKKEILEGMKPQGTAVLNGDDPLVQKIARTWKGKTITFGLSPGCDVRATSVERRGFEGMAFELWVAGKKEKVFFPFLYEDYLYNFLAAVSVCHALALPLKAVVEEISSLKPFSKRGLPLILRPNITVIDDTYNSNPRALEGALRSLGKLPASRKVAILGDMLELGEKEVEFHFLAGWQVVMNGWDLLVTVGPLARHMEEGALAAGMKKDRIFSFSDSEEARKEILSLVKEGDLILVKGSRAVQTEKIVDQLKNRFEES